MHQEPQVPNYRTGVRGMKLVPGICLAIEPMLTLGSDEVAVKPDGWTVVTQRRLAGRPFRAHDRRHGQRPRDPHDGLMTTTTANLPDSGHL